MILVHRSTKLKKHTLLSGSDEIVPNQNQDSIYVQFHLPYKRPGKWRLYCVYCLLCEGISKL